MKTLTIDVETRSPVKLQEAGVYAYASSPGFRLLLFSYSIDQGPVQVVEVGCGEQIPSEVIAAINDSSVLKFAYNAAFERVVLSRYLGVDGYLDPESWRCDMIHALYCGLPMSLKDVGQALGLPIQKEEEGKALIRKFCVPKRDGSFNELVDFPEERLRFKHYNKVDVETELELQKRLSKYAPPEFLWREYAIDQRINDTGVRVDTTLARAAVDLSKRAKNEALDRMTKLTNVENPNSVLQLRRWLDSQGIQTDTLGKDRVNELLKDNSTPERVKEVLKLRQVSGKSSTKKYETMLTALCPDGRVRGMFQFLGAKTGRWAGRLLQLHNLPRNTMHGEQLGLARTLARCNDYECMFFLYDSVPQVLSELIRTAFIPKKNFLFIVSDYSSVEARIIAYLADEKWRNEAFARGADIYCLSAEQMYGVPVVKGKENGHLRQNGKIAELACGFGGGSGAIRAFDKDGAIPEDKAQEIVSKWREASPNITALWWAIGDAAMEAIRYQTEVAVPCAGGACEVVFDCHNGVLWMRLPSGRAIAYAHPSIVENKFGGASIQYYGLSTGRKWGPIETYGPRLVENLVQATARDCLTHAMGLIYDKFDICMHIHDELVIEAPKGTPVTAITELMDATPPWAPGLLLKSEAYSCSYYQKD